jgi:peptide-methionine (S)-S-oxide reductase
MEGKITNSTMKIEIATLGNGCFWCTEAIFKQLNGIIKVTSGYSGGKTENPDYKSVCSGTTDHAECLQIEFDSNVISYEDLLNVFWKTHDPTSLNKQGGDVGTQYRSIIFYHNDLQKEIAEKYIQQLDASGSYAKPIVTVIEPMQIFYPAENYHQDYFALNGNSNPYCQVVVRPKIEKFKKEFAGKLK